MRGAAEPAQQGLDGAGGEWKKELCCLAHCRSINSMERRGHILAVEDPHEFACWCFTSTWEAEDNKQ